MKELTRRNFGCVAVASLFSIRKKFESDELPPGFYTRDDCFKNNMPCRIFDNNGKELTYCISADTRTGKVISLARTNGDWHFTEDGDDIMRIIGLHPAPLHIFPVNKS